MSKYRYDRRERPSYQDEPWYQDVLEVYQEYAQNASETNHN